MRIQHPSSHVRLAAAVLVLVAATACSREEAVPGDVAGSVDRMSAEPAASEDADTGTDQANARLPEEFPADFPLPPDFSVTSGKFTKGRPGVKANFLVRGTSTASVAEIATFYRERLPQAGFKVQEGQPVTPEMTRTMVMFADDTFQDASVQLASTEEATSVLVSLPLRD